MARQLGLEVDRARALVLAQPLVAEREQLRLERSGPASSIDGLDDGLDLLAELVVRDAEHGDVGDLRVRDQHVLGLLRVDVDAARDDHVGLAVGQVEVAVLVEVADVADRRPAVLVARVGGLVGRVVVGEARAALGPDRADLAGRQLVAVVVEDVRRADSARPTVPGLREPVLGSIAVSR